MYSAKLPYADLVRPEPQKQTMTNNDLLRRLRFAFDFSNKKSTSLFSLDPSSSVEMSESNFKARLLKDEEEGYVECSDTELSAFLDGLIVSRRGLRETPVTASPAQSPVASAAEQRLSKNDVLKKLRIAMNFREEEMLNTLKLGGAELSKSELGALFRKPKHKNYRACGNQHLRAFIKGLTIQHRETP